jgi:hypothetical protein
MSSDQHGGPRHGLLIVLFLVVLATSHATAQTLEPLEVDWEQVFRVSWEMSERYRKPHLIGKLQNISFYGTSQIQLLIDQLDASGRVVHQHVVWVGFRIAPGGSAFFDVPVPDRAATYRVRVFAFDRKFGTTGS